MLWVQVQGLTGSVDLRTLQRVQLASLVKVLLSVPILLQRLEDANRSGLRGSTGCWPAEVKSGAGNKEARAVEILGPAESGKRATGVGGGADDDADERDDAEGEGEDEEDELTSDVQGEHSVSFSMTLAKARLEGRRDSVFRLPSALGH